MTELAVTGAPTRREALGIGLAALLGAGGASLVGTAAAGATAQTDTQIVSALLQSEQLAVFAYQHVLRSRLLFPNARVLLHSILSGERAHARVLGTALLRLGGTPPKDTASVTNTDKLLAASRQPGSLAQLGNEHDAIVLLIRLEFALEGFYYEAISKLQDARLAGTLAQVMANEAQHASVLSELIRPGNVSKAVPSAFVQG